MLSELTWLMWSDFVLKWSKVNYGEVLGDKSTMYIRVTVLSHFFNILMVLFFIILYMAVCLYASFNFVNYLFLMLYILIVTYFYYYVIRSFICSFVRLRILIVMYVPFCVYCLVLFSVLFVCKCALYYCHRVSNHLQLNICHIIYLHLHCCYTIDRLGW
jgi:hypothetical protein